MNKEIFRLAIPNILSNISVPLLSTVDTALMGRLSEYHIGAVGLGSMIFNFVYWNFGFLRMGTTGLAAQAFGRRDRNEISLVLGRALAIALILAFAILILQYPFCRAAVALMQVEADLRPLVEEYFQIRIWAAPATLCMYALLGWFFGMQNAIIPLIITVALNVVNIVLSYLLVFRFGMDIAGVAWGTVAAQYFGLILTVFLLYRKYADDLRTFSLPAFMEWSAFGNFLRINRDIFLRTLLLTFAFGFFYSQSSSLGETVLAVNVILLQYVNWMSYGIDGFAYAAESLVGKYVGAADRTNVSHAIRLSFFWAGLMAVSVGVMYGVFGDELFLVFTDDLSLLAEAQPYIFWMAIFPVAGFACYIWDGIFIGMTASRAMRNTMVGAAVVYLIAYYGLTPVFGNHGLWIALIAFLIARALFQWFLFARHKFALR